MKKNLIKLAGLVISAMLLGACSQMATYENEDLLANQEVAAKNGFNLTPFGTGGNENARAFGGDCVTDCLTKGTAYTFTEDYSTTASSGSNFKLVKATLTVSITTGNVATYTLDMSSERTSGTTNAAVSFSGNLNGVVFNSGPLGGISTKRSYSTSITNVDYTGVACGNTISFSLTEVSFGDEKTLSDTNDLLPYCLDGGCDNEMTADLTCGDTNTVVFTFYAEEAGDVVIQGGLNANASITSASAVGVDQVFGHPSTNGKADVTRWAGNVDACEMITVTVSWTGPATIGDWSAKRGDVTLAEVLGSTVICN